MKWKASERKKQQQKQQQQNEQASKNFYNKLKMRDIFSFFVVVVAVFYSINFTN